MGHRKTAAGLPVSLVGIVLKNHVFVSRGCREGCLARLEQMEREGFEILAECVLASIFEVGLDHLACRAERLEQIKAEALVRNSQAQQSAMAEKLMSSAQKRNRIWKMFKDMRSNAIIQIPNLVSELRFYRCFVGEQNVYGFNFFSSNAPLSIFLD